MTSSGAKEISQLSEERTPRDWQEEFEDIVDDPKQQPIKSYEDEDANLGPAVGEGGTLEEAREEWKRNREERDQS
jgi:hypothetical protein